jgi:hypothetical protein
MSAHAGVHALHAAIAQTNPSTVRAAPAGSPDPHIVVFAMIICRAKASPLPSRQARHEATPEQQL